MSTFTTNITHELDNISNTLRNEVERINEQIRIRDSRLDQVEKSLNDIDRRRRDKFQLRDHTLDLVENSLKHMDQRRQVLIEAESMLESSSLEDIIELKPEAKKTQDLECCLAAEIGVKNIMVHTVLVVSAEIQDAVTQINEEIRFQDFRIGERNFLDGRMRGK